MKILHLPLTVPGSEQVGQTKGFQEVFEDYRQFDYLPMEGQEGKQATNEALIATIRDFQPDVIWAQLQETDTIMPQTWEQIRREFPNLWLTCWSGDAREYVPVVMQNYLPHFDIFYNDTDQKELYLPHCRRYEFMPIAVDPEEATDYSYPTPNAPEIVFIGNNYGNTFSNGPFRLELMEALTKEFGNRFGVLGNSWPMDRINYIGNCPVKHQGAYYHQAKVVVSVDHIKDILHWSERLIWAMASGTPTIMQMQRNFDWAKEYHISDGASLESPSVVTFETIDDCISKIHWFLENDEARDKISETAQLAFLTKNTWKQRAERVKLDYSNAKGQR